MGAQYLYSLFTIKILYITGITNFHYEYTTADRLQIMFSRKNGNRLLASQSQIVHLCPARPFRGQSIQKIATLDFDVLLHGHCVPLQDGASVKLREFTAALRADS